MKLILSYGYRPHTTAAYYEEALQKEHNIFYFGPPYKERPGYLPNEDVIDIINSDTELPDLLLFVEPGINFFPRGLDKLTCPTACYLIDVHRSLWIRELYAQFFDYIFVAQKDYIEHFKKLGYRHVYWLPLACDPEIHGEITAPRIYDIGFVGKTFDNGHARKELLEKLSRKYKINDYKRWYPREEISTIYSQSRITINISANGDLNMRVFEAMAGGAMLITESIENGQRELFKDGVHLVEFSSEAELFDRVDYYLKYEEKREQIAKAGQELVLHHHTYNHRAGFILDAIFGDSKPVRGARIRTMKARDVHIAYAKIYSMLRLVDPVFNEIKEAYKTRDMTISLLRELFKSFFRAFNIIVPLTPSARKIKRHIHKSVGP